jgi:hypothetical protein
MLPSFHNQNVYYGDIHNHCAVGYGHGTFDEALQNARLQLDFACVTVHAHWGDLPKADARLAEVVAYHEMGFERTAQAWDMVQQRVQEAYEPGRFVTFLGHEWHSLTYGDHNIYYKEPPGEILQAADLPELKKMLAARRAQGRDVMLLPHHIGYRQGYRGINWSTFSNEFSPVVEIYSMHGASESADAPYPYLHTMGPRDQQSTYHYGLSQGHVVGVMASTDHHSAHPGSYGHGRLAVWAPELTRDAIWDAIYARRTYALTGDRIGLAFALNGEPMGAVAPAATQRQIEIAVEGGAAIDYVELLHNNRVLHHYSLRPSGFDPYAGPLKVHVEVGWGEKGEDVSWDVALLVEGGELHSVEPRFRGHEIVAPQVEDEASYAFSSWEQAGNRVSFRSRTWGNATTTTASTQGVSLTLSGGPQTLIRGCFNGKEEEVTLAELVAGPRGGYLGGFLTPAYALQRAVPRAEYMMEIATTHEVQSSRRDWYTVRVRQRNGQWAWSSPIWVEAGNGAGR